MSRPVLTNRFCLPLISAGAFLCALAIAFFWLAESRALAATRPNVVLIQVDDMARAQMRSEIYEGGSGVPAMPNVLERIGARGVELNRYYASNPICGPSRASLLTGQATHNHGVRTNAFPFGYPVWQDGPDSQWNLPVWLQQNDYRTAHIGKYINGYGFDPETEVPPGWSRWVTPIKTAGSSYYGAVFNIDGELTAPVGSWEVPDPTDCKPVFYTQPEACQHSTDVITNFALKEIANNAAADRPFFMQVDYNAPHDDGRKPAGPIPPARFQAITPRVGQNFRLNSNPRNSSPYFIRRNEPLTPTMKRDVRERYANEVASLRGVDEGVGRILSRLRRSGQLENTYVIFTSDNGMFHGEHRIAYGKFLPQEPSSRQPFLVRGPGIPRDQRSRALGSNLSIASTVLRMTDTTAAGRRDGRSLLANLRFPKLTTEVPVLLEGFNGRDPADPELFLDGNGNGNGNGNGQPNSNQAVVLNYTGFVAGKWKYIRYSYGDEELYDLETDPGENRNRIYGPRMAPVLDWAREVSSALVGCRGSECRIEVTPPSPEK